MKIYISGPIISTDDYMERFAAAQKKLEDEGWSVVNPALVNSNLPEDTDWEDYMRMAVCMLDMCETVYFLDGWKESRGANIEYGYALEKSKGIIFQTEEGMEVPDLADLKNWIEVIKGLYRYALTENTFYEIHVSEQLEGEDIMTAEASLYITGDWRSSEEGSIFRRECLLPNRPVFECITEALRDH